jgi:signal transduction histidine kinase
MQTLIMSSEELMTRLKAHKTLKGVPDHELEWLIAHGEPRRYFAGEEMLPPDLRVDWMTIMFSGHLTIYVDRGAGARRTMDWHAGDIGGILPYSRLKISPGVPYIEDTADTLSIHRDWLDEMTRACPQVTARCVQHMLDRARVFTKHDEQDEKLLSLGRLSAGLAHELDNPAAAVMRSTKLLPALVDEASRAALALGRVRVAPDQLAAIEKLRDTCLANPSQVVRSPLEQGRHEEAIADWLDDRGIRVSGVEALAETPLTLEMLDAIERAVAPEVLEPALQWVAATCAVRSLVSETGQAATRMSELVKGVRAFTHRDEAAAPQPVDIQKSLTETLAVLRPKAKGKSVRVEVEAEPDLPRVEAVGGELNQIWSNLIDNALDAVAQGGNVRATARRDNDCVVVSIVDDGPGIPPEHHERVFEPFFTTKPVGEGTGQGLDIVQRLVRRRRGKIDLFSNPGRTEFRVTLPIVGRAPADAGAPSGDGAGRGVGVGSGDAPPGSAPVSGPVADGFGGAAGGTHGSGPRTGSGGSPRASTGSDATPAGPEEGR